jgi:hypothetical protein
MTVYNGKGYVTNWGDAGNANDDYVAVINLATSSVTASIAVVEGLRKFSSTTENCTWRIWAVTDSEIRFL